MNTFGTDVLSESLASKLNDRSAVIGKASAPWNLHRQENTDNPARLNNILSALCSIAQDLPVLLPLHPRTRARLEQQNNHHALGGLIILDPVPYLEMQCLEMSAQLALTDSGGTQNEAYFHQVPCITLRDETEWVETVEASWNQRVGANENPIIQAARNAKAPATKQATPHGDGHAADEAVRLIINQ